MEKQGSYSWGVWCFSEEEALTCGWCEMVPTMILSWGMFSVSLLVHCWLLILSLGADWRFLEIILFSSSLALWEIWALTEGSSCSECFSSSKMLMTDSKQLGMRVPFFLAYWMTYCFASLKFCFLPLRLCHKCWVKVMLASIYSLVFCSTKDIISVTICSSYWGTERQ